LTFSIGDPSGEGIPSGEERLIKFSVMIIKIAKEMQYTKAGNHLPCEIVLLVLWTSQSLAKPFKKAGKIKIIDFISQGESGQIIRSGTSPALNYGEEESGESLAGKELRETFICLKIVYRAKLYKSEDKIQSALQENNELISIFVKSIETAQKNSKKPISS